MGRGFGMRLCFELSDTPGLDALAAVDMALLNLRLRCAEA